MFILQETASIQFLLKNIIDKSNIYLLNPTYTWPKVPRPRSFPFFQREPGLGGFSVLPGLLGMVRGLLAIELFDENGELLPIFIGGGGSGSL
jgi:hypothetical protein